MSMNSAELELPIRPCLAVHALQVPLLLFEDNFTLLCNVVNSLSAHITLHFAPGETEMYDFSLFRYLKLPLNNVPVCLRAKKKKKNNNRFEQSLFRQYLFLFFPRVTLDQDKWMFWRSEHSSLQNI